MKKLKWHSQIMDEIVAAFFPYKSEVDTLALKDALDRDAPKKKGAVNWQGLFMEDREGNQVRNARTKNVGNSQSCMVSKLRIIWKQTVQTKRKRKSELLRQK